MTNKRPTNFPEDDYIDLLLEEEFNFETYEDDDYDIPYESAMEP